jgi:hypothetical protein
VEGESREGDKEKKYLSVFKYCLQMKGITV